MASKLFERAVVSVAAGFSAFLWSMFGSAQACDFQITSLTQLQLIGTLVGNPRLPLSGNYCLAGDIEANGGTIAPIGDDAHPFTGQFDGRGHSINGLRVTSNGIYVGLFAYLDTGATILNLGLTNVSVTSPSGYDVGGLVGRNSGSISRSYVTGSVTGAAGNTNGLNGIAVGGIAGWNFGTITQSYSAASVGSPGTGADLGGISGGNDGTILYSYSTGPVNSIPILNTDNFSVGGLVGRNKTGTITQSYATGSIAGGPNSVLGGLVATNDAGAGAVTNSYWDVQTTGQSTGSPGVGETTAQLKSGLPIGFDSAVWSIIPTVYYPYLQWQIKLSQLTTATNTAPYGTLNPLQKDAGVLIENETCLAVVYTMIALAAGDLTATVRDFWIDGTGANSGPLSPPIALSPSQPYETNKGGKINPKTTIPFDSSILSHLISGLALIGGTINTGSAGHQELHWMLGVGTVTLDGKIFVVANDPWTGTKVAIDLGTTNPTTKGTVTYIMDPNPARPQFNLLTAVVNKALSREINADYQMLPIASNGKTSYSALTSFTAQGFVLVSGS